MTENVKGKYWCFTLNNPPSDFEFPQTDKCTYYVYQTEIGENETPHIQGYVEFTTRVSLRFLSNLLPRAHWERRKGTAEQAAAYCKKLETQVSGPHEWGILSRPERGRRTDLESLAADVFARVPIAELRQRHPGHSLRYRAAIVATQNDLQREAFSRVVRHGLRTLVLWGIPGSGKTRSVYDHFGLDRVFTLNTATNGALWFDGYDSEPVLLIDDFRGWIRFQEVLKICDIYPYRCSVKGSFIYAAWKVVVFTSNHHYSEWWKEEANHCIEAFERRVSRVFHFSSDHPWSSAEGVDVFADLDLDVEGRLDE